MRLRDFQFGGGNESVVDTFDRPTLDPGGDDPGVGIQGLNSWGVLSLERVKVGHYDIIFGIWCIAARRFKEGFLHEIRIHILEVPIPRVPKGKILKRVSVWVIDGVIPLLNPRIRRGCGAKSRRSGWETDNPGMRSVLRCGEPIETVPGLVDRCNLSRGSTFPSFGSSEGLVAVGPDSLLALILKLPLDLGRA